MLERVLAHILCKHSSRMNRFSNLYTWESCTSSLVFAYFTFSFIRLCFEMTVSIRPLLWVSNIGLRRIIFHLSEMCPDSVEPFLLHTIGKTERIGFEFAPGTTLRPCGCLIISTRHHWFWIVWLSVWWWIFTGWKYSKTSKQFWWLSILLSTTNFTWVLIIFPMLTTS